MNTIEQKNTQFDQMITYVDDNGVQLIGHEFTKRGRLIAMLCDNGNYSTCEFRNGNPVIEHYAANFMNACQHFTALCNLDFTPMMHRLYSK